MRLVTSSYHHHDSDSDLHNTISSCHPTRRNPKRKYPWKRQSRVHHGSTLRPFMIPMMSCWDGTVRTARIIIVAVIVLMWTTPIWWCGSLTSSSSSGVIVVVTAWQLLHSIPPSSFPRRHHYHHPISQYSARYCEVTSTRVRGMTSFLSMSMNDSYEIEEENDDNIISIQNVMTTTSTNIEETNDEDHDTTTTTSTTMIPANLRRKIQAKRPTLGHVVPYKYKQSQQQSHPPPPQTTAVGATGGSIPSQLRLQGRRDTVDSITNTNSPNYLIKIMAGISRGRKLESPSTVYLRPMMGKVKEAMYSTLTSFGIYHTDDPSKHYQSIRHLDIFAGSGSVGLESLSRGATHCTFVDFSMDCCQCIQRNIDLTGLGTTTTSSSSSSSSSSHLASPETKSKSKSTMVCCTDAMTALTDPYSVGVLQASSSSSSLQNVMTPYQIITICPPYEEVVYGDLLEAVVGSDAVTEDTIVIIEYPIELLQSPKQNKKNPISRSSAHSGMPHVIQSKSNTAIGIRNRKYGRTVIAFYIINPTGRYPDASSRPEEFVYPV